MSKPGRRRKAVSNGTDPGPIERAIDTAAASRAPVDLTLKLDRAPLRLKPRARITIRQGSDTNQAEILVRDANNVWHGVLMPPGATYELREAGPTVDLWTPPGSKR